MTVFISHLHSITGLTFCHSLISTFPMWIPSSVLARGRLSLRHLLCLASVTFWFVCLSLFTCRPQKLLFNILCQLNECVLCYLIMHKEIINCIYVALLISSTATQPINYFWHSVSLVMKEMWQSSVPTATIYIRQYDNNHFNWFSNISWGKNIDPFTRK